MKIFEDTAECKLALQAAISILPLSLFPFAFLAPQQLSFKTEVQEGVTHPIPSPSS